METKYIETYLRKYLASASEDFEFEELLKNPFVADTLFVLAKTASQVRNNHDHATSSWFWEGWGLDGLDEKEKSILRYYFPLISVIQSEGLIAQCLETVFQVPFKVNKIEGHNVKLTCDGSEFDNSFFHIDCYSGGSKKDIRPCIFIQIGPLDDYQIDKWTNEGKNRNFLEKTLLPLILSDRFVFEIVLTVNNTTSKTYTKDNKSYWEVNFVLS